MVREIQMVRNYNIENINFSKKNMEECTKLNWTSKVDYLKELIKRWEKHTLTFYGKNTVIKTILLPKITHLLQNMSIPKESLNN